YIHPQLEWMDIQLSYCGFSACNPFQLSNQTLAHHVVERICSDVPKQPCPSEDSGDNQDHASLPQLAPARFRRGGAHFEDPSFAFITIVLLSRRFCSASLSAALSFCWVKSSRILGVTSASDGSFAPF